MTIPLGARLALYGLGAAAAGTALYFALFHRRQMELPPPEQLPPGGAGMPTGQRVQNWERANGAVAPLQEFLGWWAANGPFPIMVAPDGGMRTDNAKQADFYARGLSKAKNLEQTPHGRGAALDLWPVGFNPGRSLSDQPEIKRRFEEMGRLAKARGFVWGGDWGWDFPHIEVKSWAKLYPYTGPKLAGLFLAGASPLLGLPG